MLSPLAKYRQRIVLRPVLTDAERYWFNILYYSMKCEFLLYIILWPSLPSPVSYFERVIMKV